jgi:hypothetical protein
MHEHDHEHLDTDTAAAPRARSDAPDARIVEAAVAGRTEVLGSAGVLGLQRVAGNAATSSALEEDGTGVRDVVSGSGQPLDDHVRTDMEARLGHDFGDVRVHTGDTADASARSVSAHAYTVGADIVFQRGAYDPGTTTGKTTLAHELTHVVQQRSGPVDGTPMGGGVSVSDPSDRFEREASATAERVMSEPAPLQRHAEDHDHDSDHDNDHDSEAAVQREEEQEEELQALHDDSLGTLQREEEPEEEEMPA